MFSLRSLALIGICALPVKVQAQTQIISETPKTNQCYSISIATNLKGTLKLVREGKPISVPISAKNEHIYPEKVLQVNQGSIHKVARYYDKANSSIEIGENKMVRTLRDDRHLIVAQNNAEHTLRYCPAGPLTRTELELIAEHFDSLAITGLLPSKPVEIGGRWKIANSTTQELCLFDGLVAQTLEAQLKEVKDGLAIISIDGTANGIELGAAVKLEIHGTVQYDLLARIIKEVQWNQKDFRDQGPASPATEIESTTVLHRMALTEDPVSLNKVALSSVPQENDPQELLKQILTTEPGGRYSFLHNRDWHEVAATDRHLVMRLIDRGDFVMQVTIAVWTIVEPGKHTDPEEFKKAVSTSTGWEQEEIVEAGEVPTDEGRWLYRVTAKGELDGVKVVQNFFLLAGPQGQQLIFSFTMKPANAAKVATQDVSLINSVEFTDPLKKK